MSPTEANTLAVKIHDSWPTGRITIEEWAIELADLDAGTVGTTIIRLRRELEHQPTIARFRAFYRSLHTAAKDTLPGCGRCQDGAITVWLTRNGHRNRYAYACSCPAGPRNHPTLPTVPTNLPPDADEPDHPRDTTEAARTDAIARLEWKVSTGSATPADIEALDGLLAVTRSRHPSAHEPYQPTLTEDQPCQP